MARTKSFKELVQHHVKGDAQFAEALLREGVDAMLSGDVETGKIILRDYIKATVGFEKLGGSNWLTAEEPDPYVWSARQPAGQEPFQRNRLSAKASGRASSRGARLADFDFSRADKFSDQGCCSGLSSVAGPRSCSRVCGWRRN